MLITYIALVLFLCLANFSNSTLVLPEYYLGIRIDRLFHFLMFFPYSFICYPFIKYKFKKISKIWQLIVVLIISGIVLATLVECSQEALTTYRESDPIDLLANLIGILSGSVLLSFLLRILKRTHR